MSKFLGVLICLVLVGCHSNQNPIPDLSLLPELELLTSDFLPITSSGATYSSSGRVYSISNVISFGSAQDLEDVSRHYESYLTQLGWIPSSRFNRNVASGLVETPWFVIAENGDTYDGVLTVLGPGEGYRSFSVKVEILSSQ